MIIGREEEVLRICHSKQTGTSRQSRHFAAFIVVLVLLEIGWNAI